MTGAPVKKLPTSPRVSSPSVPVADRGGEEINVGFSDFGAGSSNQLRDPRLGRSAGNDRKFSLGNEFHIAVHKSSIIYWLNLCRSPRCKGAIVAMDLLNKT